jgi:hypothetical protein
MKTAQETDFLATEIWPTLVDGSTATAVNRDQSTEL